ncbi:hypothetical protein LS73_005680 [Helicobacter muridarum]|uniref:ATPase YjeE, predicted to have essential role in cell wall biosynthesis n=1 Tax=Helicobacter muridarum TaxID=216 RepID=A0A099U1L5_9HELI|nr:tRNA (adenosine(37)-N6)-threonylcarbamoyltransferase complex ATPase subunit type 1 TsaE [Helicobacter muridarum]TLE00176.1 hypothetical protein LS73_005680 [Helicobacter muridarum]STQ87015.1 ATPase YjeE, predicted to have essential role in cell wall biosynthesis [Helicobacter muridarum]
MQALLSIVTKENSIEQVIDSILHYQTLGISIFLLSGDIGIGKTFLVSHYAKKIHAKGVSSPSFSFIQEYSIPNQTIHINYDKHIDNIPSIYHYDLYLKDYSLVKYELFESISKQGVHFIEWGNKEIATQIDKLGFSNILIEIKVNNNERIYEFYSFAK